MTEAAQPLLRSHTSACAHAQSRGRRTQHDWQPPLTTDKNALATHTSCVSLPLFSAACARTCARTPVSLHASRALQLSALLSFRRLSAAVAQEHERTARSGVQATTPGGIPERWAKHHQHPTRSDAARSHLHLSCHAEPPDRTTTASPVARYRL